MNPHLQLLILFVLGTVVFSIKGYRHHKKSKLKTLLWLDDIRNPLEDNWLAFSPIEQPFEVIWVKNYSEFTNWISKNGLPTAICFDHDLGDLAIKEASHFGFNYDNIDDEKTGKHCANWLVEYCMDNDLDLPLYNIQSANTVGKDNIDGLLKNFNKFRKS